MTESVTDRVAKSDAFVGEKPLEQEVEDLLADTVDLLVAHTEGPDSFKVSQRRDEKDPRQVRFVVTTDAQSKAAGIIIGRDGELAWALRTLIKHFGFAHNRKFRLWFDTPRPTDAERAAKQARRRSP